MVTDGVASGVAAVIGKVIDRVWPDENQKAAALLELRRLDQAGEFKALDAELERSRQQTEISKVEAASMDPFTSRWRPFIGWVCGSALAWHYIGAPLLVWAASLAGQLTAMPEIETGDLIVILLGMLGLGGLRTTEKIRGVVR